MAEIIITGASDDLIEIDGDISEEFNWYPKNSEDRRFIGISDGTVLSVWYDQDGLWRFQRSSVGRATFTKIEGSVHDDTNDTVSLTTDDNSLLMWVVFGEDVGYWKKPQP